MGDIQTNGWYMSRSCKEGKKGNITNGIEGG